TQRQVALREERPDLLQLYNEELAQAEATRLALTTGPYPGMGTGDPDLYKAFCWRFWQLVAEHGGRVGVVLPRSALSAKGTTQFRQSVFGGSARTSVTMLINTGGWVFDEAEHRYTIGLLSIERNASPVVTQLVLRGPYNSLTRYWEGMRRPPTVFQSSEVV